MKAISFKKLILILFILMLFGCFVALKLSFRDTTSSREKMAYNMLKSSVEYSEEREKRGQGLGSRISDFHPDLITGQSGVDLIRECKLEDYKLVKANNKNLETRSYFWYLCKIEGYNVYFSSINIGPGNLTDDKFGVCKKAKCPALEVMFSDNYLSLVRENSWVIH